MRIRAPRKPTSSAAPRHWSRPEDGAILVIFAIALTAIVGFAAMAVDLGNTAQSHVNAQNGADSVALAGAIALANGATETAVVNAITADGGIASSYASDLSWTSPPGPAACDPPSPFVTVTNTAQTQCVAFFTPPGSSSTVIWVEFPPQHLPSLIGSAGSVNVIASAEATYSGPTSSARLCWGTPGSTGNCKSS